jgi:hypothetical protein
MSGPSGSGVEAAGRPDHPLQRCVMPQLLHVFLHCRGVRLASPQTGPIGGVASHERIHSGVTGDSPLNG